MTVTLDNHIVPARNKEEAAEFFARILGVRYAGVSGRFARVHVNDTLSFNFDDRESFDPQHYAFEVTDEEFDAILARLQEASLIFGSDHFDQENGQINTRRGGRGFYFKDPSGHSLQVVTRSYQGRE